MDNSENDLDDIIEDINNVDIDDLFKQANITTICRSINPKYKVKSEYIYLDTARKNDKQSTIQTLKWDMGFNKELTNINVVNVRPIKNIIGMRLATLRLGYFTRGIIPLTAVNFQLSIEEFKQQSILLNNIQEYPLAYHFSLFKMQKVLRSGTDIGTYDVVDPYFGYPIFDIPAHIDLVCNNNGYFWFSEPINEMPLTLSLTMSREYNKTIFPVDGNIVALGVQSTLLNNSTSFLLYGWVGPEVVVGQTAVITGLTIDSPVDANDYAMLDYINRPEGFIITRIVNDYAVYGESVYLIKACLITLDMDTLSMSLLDNGNGLIQNSIMLFPDTSIIIPLELIYLDDEN